MSEDDSRLATLITFRTSTTAAPALAGRLFDESWRWRPSAIDEAKSRSRTPIEGVVAVGRITTARLAGALDHRLVASVDTPSGFAEEMARAQPAVPCSYAPLSIHYAGVL